VAGRLIRRPAMRQYAAVANPADSAIRHPTGRL